jgi:hypothetical protein
VIVLDEYHDERDRELATDVARTFPPCLHAASDPAAIVVTIAWGKLESSSALHETLDRPPYRIRASRERTPRLPHRSKTQRISPDSVDTG